MSSSFVVLVLVFLHADISFAEYHWKELLIML